MPLAIYESTTDDPVAKAGKTIARIARRHDNLNSFAGCIADLEDVILTSQAQFPSRSLRRVSAACLP